MKYAVLFRTPKSQLIWVTVEAESEIGAIINAKGLVFGGVPEGSEVVRVEKSAFQ